MFKSKPTQDLAKFNFLFTNRLVYINKNKMEDFYKQNCNKFYNTVTVVEEFYIE